MTTMTIKTSDKSTISKLIPQMDMYAGPLTTIVC
jgi:hypothetical protein